MDKTSGIGALKGIGAKTEQLFHNLGVYTVGDILLHYPKDYERMPPITPLFELPALLTEETTDSLRQTDEEHTVKTEKFVTAAIAARIDKVPFVRAAKNMQVTSLALKSQEVKAELVWFRMPYLKSTLKIGQWFVFLGKVMKKGQSFHMEQPQIFTPEKYQSMQNCLWPCYALTAGLGKNKL